jgi:hypothetical protein
LAELRRDGLDGDEQQLGDLAISQAASREIGHPAIADRRGLRSAEPLTARARRRPQVRRTRVARAAAVRSVERLPQRRRRRHALS